MKQLGKVVGNLGCKAQLAPNLECLASLEDILSV